MNDYPIEILYRDEFFVAVDKPAGLLVHRSNIDKHESRFLLQQLRDQLGAYLYPIHRLDKPTSGLILFAFSAEIAAALQKLMEENIASKEYLLVCRGYCPEQGDIDYPLRPVDDFKHKRLKRASSDGASTIATAPKPAQAAHTQFWRLDTIELPYSVDKYPSSRYSLVLAKLLTGRKHQLRRHFKHISHPIIGCPKYGKSSHNHFFSTQLQTPRLLLHAYRMVIPHPVTGALITIVARPSGVFADLLQQLNWCIPEAD